MSIKLENFFNTSLNDISVELSQMFDRNFETKSFFDKQWPQTKHTYHTGSLLLRTGKLRRSIKSKRGNKTITWKSNLPYAKIHNEGGKIKVTPKMKRFFWAMFYKNSNAVMYSVKKKAPANTKRNKRLQAEAMKWKAMALLKVGSEITIDQRQFIGGHPQVDIAVKKIIDNNINQLDKSIIKKLKR